MREFKHTPGPWERGDGNHGGELLVYCNDTLGSAICDATSHYNVIDKQTRIANLDLIAAAPEMFEALREMVAIVKKNSYPCPDKPNSNYARAEAAEAVIAKALGK